jgi:hypothetical protein
MSDGLPDSELPRSFSLPAGMMSLVFHLVLFLVLALILPTTMGTQPPEPERAAGIVLTQHSEREEYRYVDESEQREAETAWSAADQAARASNGGPEEISEALPASAELASLSIPEIQLPGSPRPAGAPDGLLVHDLTRRTGRRTQILTGSDDELILAEQAARQAARDALGPATRVSVFGSAAAEGRSFVFAIDRSKSMGGDGLNALAAARAELARGLAHLTPKQRFQIVAYHHGCVYYKTTRLIPATEENKADIAGFIDRLAAFGGTAHETAIRAALAMEPDAVFLLTDGGDPHLNEIQLKNLRKLAEGLATIHCIQFGFGPLAEEDNFMMQLARQNGGGYTYVDMSRRGDGGAEEGF